MYRVVLDPVVLLRGLLNPHSLCGRLLSEYSDRYRAIFSEGTLRAMRFLLHHPFFVAGIPRLSQIPSSKLARLFYCAEQVHAELDPDVSVFVATARAAQADFLVCEDQVLLAQLAQGDKIGIPVLDSAAFIALLDQP